MYQYYIIELQKYQNGEYGNLTHFAYDADPDKARLKGESKYHEVLAAAAVSDLAEHGAILMSSQCVPIEHKCYTHVQTAGGNEE